MALNMCIVALFALEAYSVHIPGHVTANQPTLASAAEPVVYACVSYHNDSTWGPCPNSIALKQPLSWVNVTQTNCPDLRSVNRGRGAHAVPAPFTPLSQSHLDKALTTSWQTSANGLTANSLGSHSRYADCGFYYGPRGELLGELLLHASQEKLAAPHAERFTRGAEMASCTEYELLSKRDSSYGWMTKEVTEKCLQGRWIALWGDSTMRLVFSALTNFLAGTIEDEHFPTHDWTYQEHVHEYDNCYEGTHCHMAVQFPNTGTVVSFNFVTRVDEYPDLKQTLARYTDAELFPELSTLSGRDMPDLLLLNSGPWEYYTSFIGDAAYVENLRRFLESVVKDGTAPPVFILGNTACPHDEWQKDTMDNIARLQKHVLSGMGDLGSTIRYLDSSALFDPLPDGYYCGTDTGYHLPSIVTDARLNHALYATCR